MKALMFFSLICFSPITFAGGVMNLEGFKVAAIYSDDFNKSVEFYTNVLGFEKVDDAGGGAHLKLDRGDKSIVVYVQGGFPKDGRTADSSKISLAFDTSSVKAALAKAKELKLSISMPYQDIGPGLAMLGFLDPSGNQIMLMGAP